ncbi:mCG1029360 [Mus musculus]|nr:mCG1029360 [Mus musculus]
MNALRSSPGPGQQRSLLIDYRRSLRTHLLSLGTWASCGAPVGGNTVHDPRLPGRLSELPQYPLT